MWLSIWPEEQRFYGSSSPPTCTVNTWQGLLNVVGGDLELIIRHVDHIKAANELELKGCDL
jgi:hypothetical protein